MGPSKHSRGGQGGQDLFRERLDAIIDLKHPLVRLAGFVPWAEFDTAFGRFCKPIGRPAKATWLMVGLYYQPRPVSTADLALMRRMGIEALYRRPNTSKLNRA